LISAKFSVNLVNIYKFTSCKTVARCLTLYDSLASLQANGVLTSFFIFVNFTHEMAYLLPICGVFRGIWLPECGRPSLRSPKAHCCFSASVLSHFASKSNHGSLQWASLGKNKTIGVIFHVLGQTFPYGRFAQILGYVFDSWT